MDRRQALAELQKATIETSAGGQLTPEQANAFIQEVMEKSGFGNAIEGIKKKAPKGTFDKMGNASRLIRGRKENSDDGYRAGITHDDLEYDAHDLKLPWEITEDYFHENIEGESVEAKILNRMTAQFALDLDDLNINGDEEDEGEEADFVALDDGLIKLATTSEVTHHVKGAKVKDEDGEELKGALSKEIFFQIARALPDKYKNSGGMKWLMSPTAWMAWVEYLTGRPTGVGDAALTSKAVNPLGIAPLVGASSDVESAVPGIPAWPDDLIMLADPKNFARVITWDIERLKVTGQTDWELAMRRKRGYVFFIKQDFIVTEDDAVAYADELTGIATA